MKKHVFPICVWLCLNLFGVSCAALKLAKTEETTKAPTTPSPHTPETTPPVAVEPELGFAEPQGSEISQTLSLWATYYRIHVATPQKKGIPLVTHNNKTVGVSLSEKDWCEAALEGTLAVVQNQKTTLYNYLDHKGKPQAQCSRYYGRYLKPGLIRAMNKTRFVPSKAAYGYGVQDWRLAPYRTIAVDPSVIPYGSLIYIPAARGLPVKLPDGQQFQHDGYFFAGDTGGAIKHNHIDVFAGFSLDNPFPAFIKNSAKKPFRAYLVNNETIRNQLQADHSPQLKSAQNPL